ncbi:type VII secretion protein EsaA [Bacillus paramycoides]|uniref:type VII secretion protein EsaA n=1 Tax=Bacillus paramycoides TaxID=2026194 RepID=UPI002E1A6E39|nr:type VII secretion protein EsaA [Bacillus paramycoides]MED1559876.1 type VII secretion protein EsaA [Bacillus paramycoides]
MIKKYQSYFPLLIIILGGLFLILTFTYFGFKDDNVYRSTNQKVSKVQYVLVNEDKGAVFEGRKYELGADFVTLINQDSKNSWQTVSRNIANAGIENGQFDAEIIIPQDFSERLLSLQSIAPEKATINYRVRKGQNEISNQAVQTQVNDILKDFNQRVVQMYFSSIVGNLSEAQLNVNKIVGAETDAKKYLMTNIQDPFKELSGGFNNLSNVSSILDEDNKGFLSEQQAFVSSVKTLMDDNNKSLEAGSTSTKEAKKSVNENIDKTNQKLKDSLKQFEDQFNLQKTQFEDQFKLQKTQLENQRQSDLSGYKAKYDGLNQSMFKQLGNFYTSAAGEVNSSGVYTEFLLNAKLFQETQTARIGELNDEIKQLQSQVETLTDLRKKIAQTYFGSAEKNPDTASEEDIKQAIVKLMADSKENKVNLDNRYRQMIEESLPQIPADTLENLLQKLIAENIITDSQSKKFQDELTIVRRYAKNFEKEIGKEGNFSYLEGNSEHNSIIPINGREVTISIDPTKDNRISLKTDHTEQGSLGIRNLTDLLPVLKTELDQKLKSYGYISEWSEVSNHEFSISLKKNPTEPEKPKPPVDPPTDPEKPKPPVDPPTDPEKPKPPVDPPTDPEKPKPPVDPGRSANGTRKAETASRSANGTRKGSSAVTFKF